MWLYEWSKGVDVCVARTMMEERGEIGQIHPSHLRSAYQRLKEAGKLPYVKPKPIFRRR